MNWISILSVTFFCFLQWQGIHSQQIFNQRLSTVIGEDPAWSGFHNFVREQLEEKGIANNIATLFHDFFAAIKSTSFPTAVATNISQQCIDDSQFYVHSLYQNISLWALQMQESSGQMPPGLFGSYNIHADGLFDECLAIQSQDFQGQYCTVAFLLETVDPSEIIPTQNNDQLGRRNPLALIQLLGFLSGSDRVEPKVANADPFTDVRPSVSFCLPSSCSAEDLGKAVAQLIGEFVIANQSVVTITDEQYCFKEKSEPKPLDGVDITFIVVLSFLGLLVISATIHEAWRMYSDVGFDAKEDGHLVSALHCFSVLNNGRKLLSMKVSTSTDNFSCFHGLRFFSTCWVVLGHTWVLSLFDTLNVKDMNEQISTWGMQILANGSVSVDTFFVMSGLLVSFLLLKELDRTKGRFNVGLFYLHRYLRLTILYAFILGFIATLIVYVGSGPTWFNVTLFSNACRITWWRQFLYINNLFPSDPYNQCLSQSWYLAVDMQLFVIAPLLIYPLWRWRNYGLAWLGFVTLLSHASIFALYAVYDLEPTSIATRSDGSPYYFDKYYVKPWSRAPPYLVGIFMGWFLYVTKDSRKRLSKVFVALGWALATVVFLAVLYGMVPYLDPVKVPEIDPIVKMTYGPLHRTAWGMVIAWIIFACSRGYGGQILKIYIKK